MISTESPTRLPVPTNAVPAFIVEGSEHSVFTPVSAPPVAVAEMMSIVPVEVRATVVCPVTAASVNETRLYIQSPKR